MGLRSAIADWGGAVSLLGTALIIGLGAAMVASHAEPFREAVREQPFERTCQSFLEAPRTARWVSVNGCTPRALAKAPSADATPPEGAKLLSLVAASGKPPEPPRVLLQTSDEGLVTSVADGGTPGVRRLTGLVEDREGTRVAVLVDGSTPERLKPIALVLLGIAVMTLAFVPLVRRVQVLRLR